MAQLYEVVLNQTYSNQQMVNRFNFVTNDTPSGVTGALALATAFGAIPDGGSLPSGTLLQAILALQVADVECEQLIVKAILDPLDFYDAPFVPQAPGHVGDGGDSPTVSVGFLSNQTRRDIRHGTKRFTGVPLSQILGGGGFQPAYFTKMLTAATAMGTPLVYPLTGTPAMTFTQVICGKEKYAVPGSSPVSYAYRYYSPLSVQLDHITGNVTWQPYRQTRSQVSRQYGRGV